jgi:hypothetical protein
VQLSAGLNELWRKGKFLAPVWIGTPNRPTKSQLQDLQYIRAYRLGNQNQLKSVLLDEILSSGKNDYHDDVMM